MFDGQPPAVTVKGRWQRLGRFAGLKPADGGDSPAASVPLDRQAAPVQRVRLSFAEREAEALPIIPELEPWAREQRRSVRPGDLRQVLSSRPASLWGAGRGRGPSARGAGCWPRPPAGCRPRPANCLLVVTPPMI